MRVPRTVIIHPVLLGILGGAIVILLGAGSTPRDSQGRPLLLLPGRGPSRTTRGRPRDGRASLRYSTAASQACCRRIPRISWPSPGQAQTELERSALIVQAIEGRNPPPVLAPLADEMRQTAQAYQEAAVAASQAVSVPDAPHMQKAQAALGEARQDLVVLEKNPWLTSEP